MKKISYLNDKVIKKILGSENKEIRSYIARLISNVTDIPLSDLEGHLELVHPDIGTNINIINSEADEIFKNEYMYFSIEINYSKSSTAEIKNLSYIYQLSLRELKNSKDYKNMKKVVQININSYDYFGKNELIYQIGLEEKKYHLVYTDQMEIYLINLSYYKNIDYNEIKEKELLKLLAIFVIEDEEFLNKLYKGDKIMEEIKNKLDYLTHEIDEVLFYNEADLQRQIEEEMMEKGLQKGIEQGKIEVAKSLLNSVMTIEEISKHTKLSVEEIEKL